MSVSSLSYSISQRSCYLGSCTKRNPDEWRMIGDLAALVKKQRAESMWLIPDSFDKSSHDFWSQKASPGHLDPQFETEPIKNIFAYFSSRVLVSFVCVAKQVQEDEMRLYDAYLHAASQGGDILISARQDISCLFRNMSIKEKLFPKLKHPSEIIKLPPYQGLNPNCMIYQELSKLAVLSPWALLNHCAILPFENSIAQEYWVKALHAPSKKFGSSWGWADESMLVQRGARTMMPLIPSDYLNNIILHVNSFETKSYTQRLDEARHHQASCDTFYSSSKNPYFRPEAKKQVAVYFSDMDNVCIWANFGPLNFDDYYSNLPLSMTIPSSFIKRFGFMYEHLVKPYNQCRISAPGGDAYTDQVYSDLLYPEMEPKMALDSVYELRYANKTVRKMISQGISILVQIGSNKWDESHSIKYNKLLTSFSQRLAEEKNIVLPKGIIYEPYGFDLKKNRRFIHFNTSVVTPTALYWNKNIKDVIVKLENSPYYTSLIQIGYWDKSLNELKTFFSALNQAGYSIVSVYNLFKEPFKLKLGMHFPEDLMSV